MLINFVKLSKAMVGHRFMSAGGCQSETHPGRKLGGQRLRDGCCVHVAPPKNDKDFPFPKIFASTCPAVHP